MKYNIEQRQGVGECMQQHQTLVYFDDGDPERSIISAFGSTEDEARKGLDVKLAARQLELEGDLATLRSARESLAARANV